MFDVDALIAGGGPSGCATAAALARLGMRVLLADAGVDRHRRLAGELMHPPGVEDLRALGFGPALDRAGGQEVVGFAVIDAREGTSLLPYEGSARGFALEHAAFTLPLLDALESRPGIRVLRNARVTEVLRNDADGVEVTLVQDARATRLRARLLVAADGRSSPLRKAIGIAERYERLSTMIGVRVDPALLPHPGHGHLFVGGPTPVLAYAIAPDGARVMVDVPLGTRPERLREDPLLLEGVPAALRDAILASLEREPPRIASNDTRLPETVVKGSAVLVGDAAGCCHPLSASGMTAGTRDARELQRVLEDRPTDVPAALAAFARRRRPAQRTRIALASALYRAFAGRSAEMAALRAGLFRTWARSSGGARTSMALLSTRESRMWVMAREYARVVANGIAILAGEATRRGGRPLREVGPVGMRLVDSAWPHFLEAVRGAVADRRTPPRLPAHLPTAAEPPAPSRAPSSRL